MSLPSQPEMREFIQTALDLGWNLISYEANGIQWLSERHDIKLSDPDNRDEMARIFQSYQAVIASMEFTNWREEQQAQNIIRALKSLPEHTPLLVWCGNGHLSKRASPDWLPMGYQFQRHSEINPFVIDQTPTVKFDGRETWWYNRIIKFARKPLKQAGGTAGLLAEEAVSLFEKHDMADAFLFSTQNDLE